MSNLLANASDGDLRRFALCWLNSDRQNTDWDKAAAQYDPTVKVASFKTVTKRAADKVFKDAGTPEAGKKRKTNGTSDDGAATPTPAKKKAKSCGKGKKAKSEEAVADEDIGDEDAPVKNEGRNDEEDDLLG